MSASGSRPDSQVSGPTLMSAASSEVRVNTTTSAPFTSAVTVDFSPSSGTHLAHITSAPGARPKGKVRQRYVFAVLSSIGLAITYGLKVNFHVCIVAMINQTALKAENNESGHGGGGGGCYSSSNSSDGGQGHAPKDGPFAWGPMVQGVLLSSYFYGYIVTQVIGGQLAEKLSAKWTFAIATLLTVFFTLLTPLAAFAGWGYLLACRVLEGMMGGVTLPSTHVMLAKWVPKSEMSRLSSLVYAGLSLGTVVSVSVTGLTAGTLGWEWVFYTQGGVSLIWCVLWCVLVYDCPTIHPWISDRERDFIIGNDEDPPDAHSRMPVPWKSVLKSKAFWAIMISHAGGNTGWYLVLTELPSYMSGILGYKIKANAVLSAVPFLVMWVYSIGFGSMMDYLGKKEKLTRTQIVKLATAIAAYIPALCLVLVTFVGCNRVLAVIILTICTGAYGSMYSGYLANHIQIAPTFAGSLMAVTNTVATLPGVIVPSFVGVMIEGNNTIGQWRIIFIITAGILLAHATQYMFLASGVEEEWSTEARHKAHHKK